MVMTDPTVPALASGFDDRYYDWFAKPAGSAVRRLAWLAGAGPVMELGIGTGRVAVPLRECGVAVHGIDCSAQMVASMRRKPGGRDIPVTMGDFADVAVSGEFSVIYLASGTFFELTSQQAQLRCLRNAAGHLRPAGVVVLDAFFPEALAPCWPPKGERTVPASGVDPVRCTRTLDRAAQRYYSSYTVTFGRERHARRGVVPRYAGMGELDLMACAWPDCGCGTRWGDSGRRPGAALQRLPRLLLRDRSGA